MPDCHIQNINLSIKGNSAKKYDPSRLTFNACIAIIFVAILNWSIHVHHCLIVMTAECKHSYNYNDPNYEFRK